MKILAIGDVTSPAAAEYLSTRLWSYRRERGIDFCVVNAENAGFMTGASPDIAKMLLAGGADCLTGGNHTMRNRSVYTFLDDTREMLRPINFGDSAPGRGYTVLDAGGVLVLVISAMGCIGIEPRLNSPFDYIERALKDAGEYDIALLDIHAEATGEKLAIAHAFDGRIHCIFGTHTHVPTADEQILPHGSGYISDVGMCGESGGILGMEIERTVLRMKTQLPYPFIVARGPVVANGVIFTLDDKTRRVISVERVKL
ncbi:MAG: YmdB family metallophosphoesterase [Clostridia bacterium]|nr:YmdB family metallophosphoesterase [Clostridia bacterium]